LKGFFCINEDYLMRIGLVKTFDRLPYLNNNLIANIAKSKAEQISFLNPIKCCVFHQPLLLIKDQGTPG